MRSAMLSLLLILSSYNSYAFANSSADPVSKAEASEYNSEYEQGSKSSLAIVADYVFERAAYIVAGGLIQWFLQKHFRAHRDNAEIVRLQNLLLHSQGSERNALNRLQKIAEANEVYKEVAMERTQMVHKVTKYFSEGRGNLIDANKRLLSELDAFRIRFKDLAGLDSSIQQRKTQLFELKGQLLAVHERLHQLKSTSDSVMFTGILETYRQTVETLLKEKASDSKEYLATLNELLDLTAAQN